LALDVTDRTAPGPGLERTQITRVAWTCPASAVWRGRVVCVVLILGEPSRTWRTMRPRVLPPGSHPLLLFVQHGSGIGIPQSILSLAGHLLSAGLDLVLPQALSGRPLGCRCNCSHWAGPAPHVYVCRSRKGVTGRKAKLRAVTPFLESPVRSGIGGPADGPPPAGSGGRLKACRADPPPGKSRQPTRRERGGGSALSRKVRRSKVKGTNGRNSQRAPLM
jgi:hypothetical protein